MKHLVSTHIDWPAIEAILPISQAMSQCPQDPIYHAEGDVWTHTKMVVNSLVADTAWQKLSETDQFTTFWAAVLHDIGKPLTTKHEGGRITSKGHSGVGAVDARIFLWKHGVDFDIREQICHIIELHQTPFFMLSNPDTLHIARKIEWLGVWDNLLLVAKHDMQGRHYIGQDKCLEDIELLALWHTEQDFHFADDYTRVRYLREPANIDPTFGLHNPQEFTVTMVSGLPASGKNTYISQYLPHLPHISFDEERQSTNSPVHAAYDKMKKLLRKKENFVFNATNLSRNTREKPLELFHNYGARVEIIYLEKSYEQLLSDDKKRDSSVGKKVIDTMLFKWQVPTLLEAETVLKPLQFKLRARGL